MPNPSTSTTQSTITPAPMIYANLFSVCNPDSTELDQSTAAATDLAGSGFVTVNLWQFHIDGSGNLLVNAAPPGPAMISAGALQSGFSYVPGVLGTLTASGSTVKTVRATIGGWQLDNTFNSIVQLMNVYGNGPANPLYQNLAALKALGVAGIDLDLEPAPVQVNPSQIYHDYPYYIGGFAQLIGMAAAVGLDVTFCPYENQAFWFALLATAYAQNGTQPVVSMNVQCYADLNNTQSGWIDAMNTFAQSGYASGFDVQTVFGVSDAASFVVPGFGVVVNGTGQCPPYFQQQLTASGFASQGITGAYLFTYGSIQGIQASKGCPGNNSTADYANALIAGINAVNGVS